MKRSFFNSILILFAFFFCAASQTVAAQTVPVRTGLHDNYVRTVFDWTTKQPYTVTRESAERLIVSFEAAADMQLRSREHRSDTALRNVRQISEAGQNLRVLLETEPSRKFRHFYVGNRVVIDVMDAADTNVVSAPESQKAEAKAAASAPPENQEKKVPAQDVKEQAQDITSSDVALPLPEVSPPEIMEVDILEAEDARAMPPPLVEISEARIEPHVIGFSSTEAIGMAAFRRGHYLWLVFDRAAVKVPPKIEGPQKALFGEFERTELKGGVAFSLKLPAGHENMNLYGEGGGLIWRVVITPQKRNAEPSLMSRIFSRETNPQSAFRNPRKARAQWNMPETTQIMDMTDPIVGDNLKIVAVSQSDNFGGPMRRMVDFLQLESPIGLAIRPNNDDLKLTRSDLGVIADVADSALAVSSEDDVNLRRIREDVQENEMFAASSGSQAQEQENDMQRIFDFDRWMLGGLLAMEDNQRIILSSISEKDKAGKVQDLLTLAKMNLANDRGQEAVGFLRFAQSEMPEIAQSPEFIALRGAAAALSGKYEMAFNDLFKPELADYKELDYWRAYTLAWLEDWQQAIESVPSDFSVLVDYPQPLLEKLGVKLAEVELRAGDEQTAKSILSTLGRDRESLKPWTIAAMDYLMGEAARQAGDIDKAKATWTKLSRGHDDWHRVKAALALTLLELVSGDIDRDRAINRLEQMRYAWRGDELEAQTNFLLGRLYIEDSQYLKGFTILRDATTMSPGSDVSRDIAAFMQSEFADLLINDQNLSPLDAVQLYEEFRELTPAGDEGHILGQKLAERLVEADLLPRAAVLLQHQVDHRLSGLDKARVALRLGTVYLMDRKPRQAMQNLITARNLYAELLEGEERDLKIRDIDLLRARALAEGNQAEEAIEMLNEFPPSPDVNRLRADLSWRSGLWDDAAQAIQDLILDEGIDMNRPLTKDQAQLILNRAVALNLAGNRVELTNMRRRYDDLMAATEVARLFEIVTRPRSSAIIADRETINSIVQEVDLFADFMNSFRSTPDQSN